MDSIYQLAQASSPSNSQSFPSHAYSVTANQSSSNQSFAPSNSSTPWYIDSAATNHITNDLANLQLYQPYQGSDQVTVGNGQTVLIQHIGKGLLPTPQYSFSLNNLLHVPNISSNLLSVHQLTKDNNCSVTFDSNSFVVQDKHTNKVLHKGPNIHGLYHFANSSSSMIPQAHVAQAKSQVSVST